MTIKIVPAETEMEYSEEYYEQLARTMGEERAAWARLPREQREMELRCPHACLTGWQSSARTARGRGVIRSH